MHPRRNTARHRPGSADVPGAADDRLPIEHVAIYGTSGSGKTLLTRALVRALPGRLPVWYWDPDNSHQAKRIASTPSEFLRVLNAGQGGALTGRATPALFAFWCLGVWAVADANRPCVAVVEELGQVTTPAKAPPEWHQLVTRGRKYGLRLVTIAQRPQEADKTILGNRRILAVGALDRRADRALAAGELDLAEPDLAQLAALNTQRPAFRHLWVRDGGKPAQLVAVPVSGARPRGLPAL